MTTLLLIIASSIAVIALAITLWLELTRDLMMFQQNSYRAARYRNWLSASKDTTSLWRLSGLVILFIGLCTLLHPMVACEFAGMFGIFAAATLARKKYKKPLVRTARANRIFATSLVLSAIIVFVAWILFAKPGVVSALNTVILSLLACYCASHIILLAANFILTPVEKAITARYYNDARRRLQSMPDLKIVGITGSYGKTSTKHYLHRILSELFDTLMTPGSFNTTLGVVRTVREYLKPYNEVFIVEMGAKNPGDIKEICNLVHPTVGIITAVGPQHLESFKTIERVQATKFELADALPSDGTIIINDDFEHIANRTVANCHCTRYGLHASGADYRAEDVCYTPQGTTFRVVSSDGWALSLTTRLMGECNVSDLLAAVVCGRLLGVPDSKIAVAVASIEPVEHRLSVKQTPGGLTILDDAFNSNPVGSRMALEVLGAMKGGQRIVITPGMIELGAEQHHLNKEFGAAMAGNVDVAIIVGQYNRDAIVEGLHEADFNKNDIHTVDTFAEAQKILTTIARKGDTILYENDLPDTFK